MHEPGDWLSRRTFHHDDFSDIAALVARKKERGLSISLCFPTLNEEATIAKEIVIIKSELQMRYPLVDEIVVIDSGSTDRTREVAAEFGAKVYLATDILPDIPPFKGKGENLWKALYVLEGDIIVYVDADIKNIHPRFVYGLVGPLLSDDEVRFVKAFYDRPIALDQKTVKPSGGGRVTELVTRPLFSSFYPDLAQFIQPLSGEYAGFRECFDSIPFPIGYGVETSMLMDIYDKYGMDAMAQVDLDKRVHRNQTTVALGRMSFGIIQTFIAKLRASGKASMASELYKTMIQFELEGGTYRRRENRIDIVERQPIIDLPEYRAKFPERADRA
ncbi:MAG: glucosyl-3-phosphoglycerate synthase [Spirochaetae bacterium HGW-Spirochaetae-3]|jgi:glucosyl-3-phosphoglycerate synthase|nr:MAG: glucosyl-3-phosphoglycerate synthase [Spirochaetae bacterium HGW-Spirochaetae-3]